MTGRPVPPLNVLIVEDEAILAMDIEAVVLDTGHRVLGEVASVRELTDLSIASPDIAFVDVHLAEGSSGLDASMLIRERWPQACIVFVTANPAKVPAGHAGASGVIPKPFTEKGLIAAVRYIAEGICSPPPSAAQPSSFKAYPGFEARWPR